MRRYKIYSSYRSKKDFIRIITNSIIKPIVVYAQYCLKMEYDINSGKYEDYRGLCDRAANIINQHIIWDIYTSDKGSNITITEPHDVQIKTIHGELRHDSRIPSDCWYYQHTMSLIIVDGVKFYVDATCKQFRDLYAEMPEYYIGTKCPDWFYPDSRNPVFASKLGLWIDGHFKITYKCDDHMYDNIGIISYMQYIVHGKISDKIYHLNYKSYEV